MILGDFQDFKSIQRNTAGPCTCGSHTRGPWQRLVRLAYADVLREREGEKEQNLEQ
jgi:hypothetical protein